MSLSIIEEIYSNKVRSQSEQNNNGQENERISIHYTENATIKSVDSNSTFKIAQGVEHLRLILFLVYSIERRTTIMQEPWGDIKSTTVTCYMKYRAMASVSEMWFVTTVDGRFYGGLKQVNNVPRSSCTKQFHYITSNLPKGQNYTIVK